MNGRSLGHRGNAGGQATSVDRGGAVRRREAESPGCTADEPLDALLPCISISRLSEDFTCYLKSGLHGVAPRRTTRRGDEARILILQTSDEFAPIQDVSITAAASSRCPHDRQGPWRAA